MVSRSDSQATIRIAQSGTTRLARGQATLDRKRSDIGNIVGDATAMRTRAAHKGGGVAAKVNWRKRLEASIPVGP